MRFQNLFFLFLFLIACDENPTPKPRGYYRITLPEHQYKVFDPVDCPFRFEIPSGAQPLRDTNDLSEPCWWYITFPQLNANIYLSYKKVQGDLNNYTEDARTLVYKHTQKANGINEQLVINQKGASGMLYDIGGEAASSVQFFMTDSTHHFLRGALYFNVVPNSDSLAPVITYLKKDIEHLLGTLEWK